jgi:7,8-dihydropterin-6-yl-methyl-4-(beta-D-ribofuranosyl)aminobenzene 5'-phosphate synthase
LIIQTEQGLIVITGCAHPGIVEIVKKAKELVKDDVLFVTGGFHLIKTSNKSDIVSSIRELGVLYVGPCHCSGDNARELFEKEYGENYVNVGVGRVLTMDDLK